MRLKFQYLSLRLEWLSPPLYITYMADNNQQQVLFDEKDSDVTTVSCKVITHTPKAWHLDVDGDKIWVPRSQVKVHSEGGVTKVSMKDWLYKTKFPKE